MQDLPLRFFVHVSALSPDPNQPGPGLSVPVTLVVTGPGSTVVEAFNGVTDGLGQITFFSSILGPPGIYTIKATFAGTPQYLGVMVQGQSELGVCSAPPTFSQTAPVPPGACLCMPPMMNIQPNQLTQNWYVKADGAGTLTVMPRITTVNESESGKMTFTVYDPTSAQVVAPNNPQTLVFPTGPGTLGTSAAGAPIVINSGAFSGGIYKVIVTLVPPQSGAVAHHYNIDFKGAIEAGMESPSLRQIEPAPATWGLNVSSGENLAVRVSSVGLIAGATSAQIVLRDPSGNAVITRNVSGSTPFDEMLSVPGAAGGRWSLYVNTAVMPGSGHYSIDKQSGPDRGIYLTWRTFGRGSIAVNINVSGGPLPNPVTVNIYRQPLGQPEVLVATFPASAGTTVSPQLEVGMYRVEIVPPPRFTADVTSVVVAVTCNKQTIATFNLTEQPSQPARTIGYWKNHPEKIADILTNGPIRLGDPPPGDPLLVSTVAQALDILGNASAKDARDMLKAQLLAAILNLRNGADPMVTGSDIRPVVNAARHFLATHSAPVDGKHPDRALALELKDKLDAFNNSGES